MAVAPTLSRQTRGVRLMLQVCRGVLWVGIPGLWDSRALVSVVVHMDELSWPSMRLLCLSSNQVFLVIDFTKHVTFNSSSASLCHCRQLVQRSLHHVLWPHSPSYFRFAHQFRKVPNFIRGVSQPSQSASSS